MAVNLVVQTALRRVESWVEMMVQMREESMVGQMADYLVQMSQTVELMADYWVQQTL